MSFLYSLLLKLLYPTSLCLVLLVASATLNRRRRWSGICFWMAVAVLLVCGNGWVVKYSTRYLERQYPPLSVAPQIAVLRPQVSGDPQPSTLTGQPSLQTDCILVLGGGTLPRITPRPTVEVAEAGDRVLYGAYLFRHGMAARILCTSGVATGGVGPGLEADTMAEFLENLGVPADVILRETASRNTHEHGEYLQAMFEEKGIKRVLLVTSAMHMPRSMGVFRKLCPGIEFVPAPTDFRVVELSMPWYRQIVNLIPTPSAYMQFSETLHEYLGIVYYKLRGWM